MVNQIHWLRHLGGYIRQRQQSVLLQKIFLHMFDIYLKCILEK